MSQPFAPGTRAAAAPHVYGTPATFAEERFPECKWRVDEVQIRQAIEEHFGPVEHLTSRRLAHSGSSTRRQS